MIILEIYVVPTILRNATAIFLIHINRIDVLCIINISLALSGMNHPTSLYFSFLSGTCSTTAYSTTVILVFTKRLWIKVITSP